MHKRTREEMVEFAIECEPGSARLKQFINRRLYDNDNKYKIDALMALQNDILKEEN